MMCVNVMMTRVEVEKPMSGVVPGEMDAGGSQAVRLGKCQIHGKTVRC
jgi:hypothetical protein